MLTAFDQDEGDILTFTLQNLTDSFEILNDNQLVQRNSFDYEKRNEYFIEIKVQDSHSPPGTV